MQYCHHQNDPCIKMGSDESRFNVSLIKTRLSTDHNFKERRSRAEAESNRGPSAYHFNALTARPNRLTLFNDCSARLLFDFWCETRRNIHGRISSLPDIQHPINRHATSFQSETQVITTPVKVSPCYVISERNTSHHNTSQSLKTLIKV